MTYLELENKLSLFKKHPSLVIQLLAAVEARFVWKSFRKSLIRSQYRVVGEKEREREREIAN